MGGYIPDLKSRYFTADFNYGLKIILEIAQIFKVNMPYCQTIYDWYEKIKDTSFSEFNISDYGIKNKNDLINFYDFNGVND